MGTTVRLYDDDGSPVSGASVTGRIFVGNGFEFSGYTGGGTKQVIDGLMSSGDVGHFDAEGRLHRRPRRRDDRLRRGERVPP